jgi:hypothetical protein
MARYLIGLFVAVLLAAAWYWFAEDGLGVSTTTKIAVPAAVPAQRPPEALDEIGVQLARRSLALDTCRHQGDKPVDELMAEYEAQAAEMLRVLGSSSDAEHLLVAALVGWRKSPEEALRLLARAEMADPRSNLIASQILELCLEIDSCSRARPEMERNLIAADKANGIAWLTVARSRLSRADEVGALAALREAVAAPSMNDQFVDYVQLFERGLAASTDLPPFERSVAALGHGAAVFTTSFLISRDCDERAEHSAEWRDVCLRLGERFEHSGRTVLTMAVGLGLQEKMYEYGGDTRAQQVAKRRYHRFRAEWTNLASRTTRAMELEDATVQRHFLDTFAAAGEIEAMQYLATEIEARLPELIEADSGCPTP